MSTILPNVTSVVPVALGTNIAGAVKRGSFTTDGGIATLSMRMVNGGTGPTVPCGFSVLVSHAETKPADSTIPNDDWFLWQPVISGGTAANAFIDRTIIVDGVRHVCVSFANNNQTMAAVQCAGTVVAGLVNP